MSEKTRQRHVRFDDVDFGATKQTLMVQLLELDGQVNRANGKMPTITCAKPPEPQHEVTWDDPLGYWSIFAIKFCSRVPHR